MNNIPKLANWTFSEQWEDWTGIDPISQEEGVCFDNVYEDGITDFGIEALLNEMLIAGAFYYWDAGKFVVAWPAEYAFDEERDLLKRVAIEKAYVVFKNGRDV